MACDEVLPKYARNICMWLSTCNIDSFHELGIEPGEYV